jgi:hypothetical protein
MSRLRQCGAVVMAFLVLWSVVPAAACLLPAGAMSRPACCSGMPTDCTHTMSADRSCCELRYQDPAAEVIPPYSPVSTHEFLFILGQTAVQHGMDSPSYSSIAAHQPAPTSSPGISTILRI